MTVVLPSIGMTGKWSLKTPLEDILIPDVIYTCRAIRSLSEYLTQNEDPYQDIYKPLGLSQSDYDTDFASNVYVVSLQSEDGTWVYIPTPYLESYPSTNGVSYRRQSVVIPLPNLPTSIDYSVMIDRINQAIFETVGITASTRVVPIGNIYLIDQAIADQEAIDRAQNILHMLTDRVQIRVLETENTRLKSLLEQLQECLNGYCRTDHGVCLPTFNPATPGESGYFDAADMTPIMPVIAMNAYDLFIYGGKPREFGAQRSDRIAEIYRSLPIEEPDTIADTGVFEGFLNESNIANIYPLNPYTLAMNKPSLMRICIGYTQPYPDMSTSELIDENLIYILPRTELFNVMWTDFGPSGNRAMNAVDLFLQS